MEFILSAQWWGGVLSGNWEECYSNHSTLTLEFLCLVFLDDSSVVSCSSGIMSHFFFLDAQDYQI